MDWLTLENAYFIASILIAAFAVSGFIYSQKTSKSVTATLSSMQHSFNMLSQPMVKLTKWNWCANKEGPISAHNLPIGILIYFANVSSVHLIILESKFEVYYGDKLLDEPGRIIGSNALGPSILSPGEILCSRTVLPELFSKYAGIEKDVSVGPHFSIKLEVKFKTIDGKVYRYYVHREINFDIRHPNFVTSKNLVEDASLAA